MSAANGSPSTGAARTSSRVGRYDILLPIASGGMATVYLARQVGVGGFQRDVALKLTHPHLREQPEWCTELLEEAKLAARIRHPNVVQVLDVGDDPQGVFLVMEYVEGETLAGLMRREMKNGGVVPLPIAARLLLDSLAGLHAAHELGGDAGGASNLVHRDFSPQNLIVGIDGITRLTDFGIAKAVERLGFTRTGTVKGKFGYMSPEQVRDLPLDRRSDVWSAGVVAWELFSGRRLFAGDQAAVLFKVLSERPAALGSVRPGVPEEVNDAVLEALVVDVGARTPSASSFSRALTDAFARSNVTISTREEVAAYVAVAASDVLSERSARVRLAAVTSTMPQAAEQSAQAMTPDGTRTVSVHVASNVPRTRGAAPWSSRASAAIVAVIVATMVAAGVIHREWRVSARGPVPAAPGPSSTEAAIAPPIPVELPSPLVASSVAATSARVAAPPTATALRTPPIGNRRAAPRAPSVPAVSAQSPKPALMPNPYAAP